MRSLRARLLAGSAVWLALGLGWAVLKPAAAEPAAAPLRVAQANPCAPRTPCSPCAARRMPMAQPGASAPCAPRAACAPCAPKAACAPCAPGKARAGCVLPAMKKKPAPCAAENPCAPKAACAPVNPCAPAMGMCAPAAPKAACAPCAPKAACAPCAPRAVCAPCAPGAVSPEQAQAAYSCLKEAMERAYRRAGLAVADQYQDWPRFSTAPYPSATHGGRYVQNYVSPDGAEAYGRYEAIGTMPAGAVVAKDSFVIETDGSLSVGPLFLMRKLEAGASPATGDWAYTMILPDGQVMSGDETQFCAQCHGLAQDTDSLYFLPEAFRMARR